MRIISIKNEIKKALKELEKEKKEIKKQNTLKIIAIISAIISIILTIVCVINFGQAITNANFDKLLTSMIDGILAWFYARLTVKYLEEIKD